MKRERKGKKGHMRCRRVGGDRGQSSNNATGKEKEERNLLGSAAQTRQKRTKHGAVQADGWEKNKRRG
jgi:hypothetical protein